MILCPLEQVCCNLLYAAVGRAVLSPGGVQGTGPEGATQKRGGGGGGRGGRWLPSGAAQAGGLQLAPGVAAGHRRVRHCHRPAPRLPQKVWQQGAETAWLVCRSEVLFAANLHLACLSLSLSIFLKLMADAYCFFLFVMDWSFIGPPPRVPFFFF